MAKLVYGLNQSLDGYVDHMKMGPPDPALFRHFIEQVRALTGAVYGRRMYEIMRYWDEDQTDWDAEEREFAAVWRSQRKWVVSRSLKSVGPNATLIEDDLEAAIRGLKAQLDGEIDVAGPKLAGSLTNLGLIDEYRLYLHPIVLGSGQPFFAGPRPRLRLVASDRIGEDVIKLTYVPASSREGDYMNVRKQIEEYIATQPEPKRSDMQHLHHIVLALMPGCKLWFLDGKDEKGKTVSNPNIGYGSQTTEYANGKTKEFYQIGISANTTGISVYVMGLDDKKYLTRTFGQKLSKASVTGYCIKFKTLTDIKTDVLKAAMQSGIEQTSIRH